MLADKILEAVGARAIGVHLVAESRHTSAYFAVGWVARADHWLPEDRISASYLVSYIAETLTEALACR